MNVDYHGKIAAKGIMMISVSMLFIFLC